MNGALDRKAMKGHLLFDVEGKGGRWFFQRRRPSTRWVEESFTFDAPVGRQVPGTGLGSYVGTSVTARTFLLFVCIFALTLGALLLRIWQLQIMHGRDFFAAAQGNRERIIPIPAERGLIFDRRGEQLTENIPSFSLAVTPQHLPKESSARGALVEKLSRLIGQPADHVWQILDEYGAYSYESIVIQENLEYETALSVQIAAAELPGIHIVRGSRRQYLQGVPDHGRSLSHVIGYEGKLSRTELDTLYADGYLPSDFIGKTGVEKTYETYLRGVYGKKRVEVNALGREQATLAEVPPTPGYHLTLSIDAEMQRALESFLEQALVAHQKKRAAGVVLDPKNGSVLALVSLPSFDNNHFSGGISQELYRTYSEDENQPLFQRAVSGMYPSGSTVKPIIAAAALAEGIITAQSVFLSTGGLRVGQWFFPDWLPGGHGWTGVIASLANSVNTFYYYIGGGYETFRGLGVEKIAKYLQLFGFGQALGVDIPGEASGFVPSEAWKEEVKREAWYIGDTYNLSIGQGDLLVTPLQVTAMTSAIANDGILYRPHVVESIVNPVTEEAVPVTPSVIRGHFIGPEHLAVVRAGMRACVTSGSCRRLADLPFAAAGKTGTAQWRADRPNHSWFTSFAPYENPKIVVTILVEEGGEGSAIAAPIAKEFYAWWWKYHNQALP